MLKNFKNKQKDKSLKSINRSLLKKEIWRHRELYLFMLPSIVIVFIFCYIPMYGVLMAFQDVKFGDAFAQSDWVGLYHFKRFFSSRWFPIVMKNTAIISLLTHVVTWPFPLLLALTLHNSSSHRLMKVVQNATYLPYLLSVTIVISILNVFCAGDEGLVNIVLRKMGQEGVNFFGDPDWVYPFHTIIKVWMVTGYSSIIYLGALAGVDEELIEAAKVDGAGKLKRIWHVQLPKILPTAVICFIINMGSVFSVGTDTSLLLQTDLNLTTSEVIGTYVYKSGVISAQYGFSTAVGLFQTLINVSLLLIVNFVSARVSDVSVL